MLTRRGIRSGALQQYGRRSAAAKNMGSTERRISAMFVGDI
jgi:hypothetical protein